MSTPKKTKGLPPGYSEKDIPQGGTTFKIKSPTPDQYDMIHTLLELPGGKRRKVSK